MNHEHAFASSLSRGIPPLEAADFFVRVKKANWADPPDETGALEGQFAAPLEQVLLKLTEVISAKFKLMVTYHIYAESMRDPAQHAIGEVFHAHAEMERAAAEAYLKRAATLGGPVHLPEIETPPASSDPIGILKIIVRAEQEAIALQRELKDMVGEDNPFRFQIEQFLIEDQHHHDEAWQMLPQETTPAPVLGVGGEESAAGAPAEAAEPLAAPPQASSAPGPSEEAPPPAPAAAAKPPAPKAESKPEPKPESKPEDKAKEAMARFRQKLAGMASDIIGDMDPNYKKRLLQEVADKNLVDDARLAAQGKIHPSKVTPSAVSSVRASGGPGSHWGDPIAALGEGKGALHVLGHNAGLLGAGTAVGAGLGALSGGTRSRAQTKRLEEGGPIQRWAAEHPRASSAILGGLTAGGGIAGGLAAPELMRPILGRHSHLMDVPGIVGGTLLPGMGLMALDKTLKNREDAAAAKTASARFLEGLRKLALMPQGLPEAGTSTDPGAAPTPEQQNAVMPQPSMAAPGPQPPMATPPGARQYEGTNYLEAEAIARQAQAQNESQFYQQQAQQAQAGAADAANQLQQIQGQLDQLQQQVDESQNQVMAAQQEAVTANDQMLNQATLAARMRMGMQQLRAQMMEIASQDPEQLAAAAGGPTPMDVGNQAAQAAQGPAALPAQGAPAGAGADPNAVDPMTGQPAAEPPQAGTPEAAPGAQAQEGSTPSGAGGGESKSSPEPKEKSDDKGGETTVSIKKGSAPAVRIKVADTLGQEFAKKLPYMGAGALIGGAAAVHGADKRVQSLREQVDALKGQQDGGFAKSLELAKAHMALSEAEEAKQHPYRAALKGGLAGAGLGAAVGGAVQAIPPAYQRLSSAIQTLRA